MKNFGFRILAIVRVFLAFIAIGLLSTHMVAAQNDPFGSGWQLNPDLSRIHFQSEKSPNKVEISSFAAFSGGIDPTGRATVEVLMDSVDTKNDLRNVRMRFLFFEAFKFPKATISIQLTPDMVADLSALGQKNLTVSYDFDLHGITKRMTSDIVVTLHSNDVVSVASAAPIRIDMVDFGLRENLRKLEETAGGFVIVPFTTVVFEFSFQRIGQGDGQVVASTEPEPEPESAALETTGDFSLEACRGRFEILSRSGNIYFRTGSAHLDRESEAILDSITDIVKRCPGLEIEVSGHTDSDGSGQSNQRLSEARADAVVTYLTRRGIKHRRIFSRGYGETRPFVPNDSRDNKRRNRRIEFSLAGS